MKPALLFLSSVLLFAACKKVEGEGGRSSIRGTILCRNYNGAGALLGEYAGSKEDVYIIYGTGDATYDDKMDASYDGSFEFKYLEPGTYTIFAYEKCAACASNEKEVLVTVELGKKETKDIGQIIIKK